MKRKNFPHRKQARRESAAKRQATWEGLTDAEKLKSLESRDHGHCKQARKLRGN